jgi:hypothetical protein
MPKTKRRDSRVLRRRRDRIDAPYKLAPDERLSSLCRPVLPVFEHIVVVEHAELAAVRLDELPNLDSKSRTRNVPLLGPRPRETASVI